MSLRHGLLDLLAGEPMSGYDLTRYFSASMGNVWPAQHSQIYPELGQAGVRGPDRADRRGPAGSQGVRDDTGWARGAAVAGCATVNPTTRSATRRCCVCSACGYCPPMRHLNIWRATGSSTSDTSNYIEKIIANRDWTANPTARASRLAIEFGRRFYAMQVEWIDWASRAGRCRSP